MTKKEAFALYQTTEYTFLNRVGSNKSCFHRLEIKGTDEARILQQLVGWTSAQTLKEAIQKNQIRNFPITTNDIIREESIYDPQLPIIQGKSIIRIKEHHKTTPRISLPPLMAKHHQNMELDMDFSL